MLADPGRIVGHWPRLSAVINPSLAILNLQASLQLSLQPGCCELLLISKTLWRDEI